MSKSLNWREIIDAFSLCVCRYIVQMLLHFRSTFNYSFKLKKMRKQKSLSICCCLGVAVYHSLKEKEICISSATHLTLSCRLSIVFHRHSARRKRPLLTRFDQRVADIDKIASSSLNIPTTSAEDKGRTCMTKIKTHFLLVCSTRLDSYKELISCWFLLCFFLLVAAVAFFWSGSSERGRHDDAEWQVVVDNLIM